MLEITNTRTGVKYAITTEGYLFKSDGVQFIGAFQNVAAAVKVALGA